MFRLEIRTELATFWFAGTILNIYDCSNDCSLRSRRLEEVGARKNGRARGRQACLSVSHT